MRKCIVISDSFKGTLSSLEICAIARRVIPECLEGRECICIPAADGGEGTVEAFISAAGAVPAEVTVSDSLGRPVPARYAVLGSTAVIEMAAAAGLPSAGDLRDPSRTTTFGAGELIRHAVKSGCREILLGLGGSATNDGGCGCAAALGVRFTGRDGRSFVPVGGTLRDIRHIDTRPAEEFLRGVRIRAMSDVANPLYGENGAAYVFAPQKGADAEMVKMLDGGLRHLSKVCISELGRDVSSVPGAGAAGGMGGGCIAFLGAEISSGTEAVLELTGFSELLDGAELVISGEGRVDAQSFEGKLLSGVAAAAKAKNVPLLVISGCIDDSALKPAADAGVTAMFSTNRAGLPFEELKGRAAGDYEAALRDVLRTVAAFTA